MQQRSEEATHERMVKLRLACCRETQLQRERVDLAATGFRHSVRWIRSLAEQTLADREILRKQKDNLKELEVDLGEALSVKSSKESRSSTIAEALSTTISRAEQLKKTVLDLRRKRDECASVISDQRNALEALEEKCNQDILRRKKMEEAIEWYSKVLGFRAKCGEGMVKFIFNKVDKNNPENDYSFSIRLENDVYKLLECNPYIEGIPELIQDLNKTNGLFKFTRIMREKFRDASFNGGSPAPMLVCPDSSSVTLSSAPAVSLDSRSQTSVASDDFHLHSKDFQLNAPKMVDVSQPVIPPPKSLSALRRSPRLMHTGEMGSPCNIRSSSQTSGYFQSALNLILIFVAYLFYNFVSPFL